MPVDSETYTLKLRHYEPAVAGDAQSNRRQRVGHVALEVVRNSDTTQEMLISFCDKLASGEEAGLRERLRGVPAQFISEEKTNELFRPGLGGADMAGVVGVGVNVGIDFWLVRLLFGIKPYFLIPIAVAAAIVGLYRQSQRVETIERITPADQVEGEREKVPVLPPPKEVVLTTSLTREQMDKIKNKFGTLKVDAERGSLKWGIARSIDSRYRNATCSSVIEEVLDECVHEVWKKMDSFSSRPYSDAITLISFFLALSMYASLELVIFSYIGSKIPGNKIDEAVVKKWLTYYYAGAIGLLLTSLSNWRDDMKDMTALLDGEPVHGPRRFASHAAIGAINFSGALFGSRTGARRVFGKTPAHLHRMAKAAEDAQQLPYICPQETQAADSSTVISLPASKC